ncbi:MAG: copper-binding protein [Gemmatimonadota bacterium]
MKLLNPLLAALMLAVALPSLAQRVPSPPSSSAAKIADLTDGEVRRIDLARGMIILKHGPIRNIGMGAMTMAFKLQDPKAAITLSAGDKVKFAAEQKGEDLVVTHIVKVQ